MHLSSQAGSTYCQIPFAQYSEGNECEISGDYGDVVFTCDRRCLDCSERRSCPVDRTRQCRIRSFRARVRGWHLKVQQCSSGRRGRLLIDRIEPVINFDGLLVFTCRFQLERGLYAGTGKLISYGPCAGENLVVEVERLSFDQESLCEQHSMFFGSSFYQKRHSKAEKLLLSFLDKEQKEHYLDHGCFECVEVVHPKRLFREAKTRKWGFYRRYHYPVEVEMQEGRCGWRRLCVEIEKGVPTEDLLLMCLLEVRAGRGSELIELVMKQQFESLAQNAASSMREFSVSCEQFRQSILRMSRAFHGSMITVDECERGDPDGEVPESG